MVEGSNSDDINQFFLINLILPAELGPGVGLTSYGNEYQKQKKKFCGVKCGRCVGLAAICEPIV
jgi:hypothetical protein